MEKIISIQEPKQCHLWFMTDMVLGRFVSDGSFLKDLEVIKYLKEPSSPGADAVTRSVRKCIDCGQLYFMELLEWRGVPGAGGEDIMNIQIIPIKEEDVVEMNKFNALELLGLFPRIAYNEEFGWRWRR